MCGLLRSLFPKRVLNFIRTRSNGRKRSGEEQFYKGEEVRCAICESQFGRFAPFGSPRREYARCPECGSLERHRLLWLYFKEKTNIFDETQQFTMLHFAPEWTFYSYFSKAANIEYTPCDLEPGKYKHGGKTPVMKVDATSIPFAENSFQVILCNHVLEHIPDDALAMREIYRVLKPGGLAILQTPVFAQQEKTYEDFTIQDPEGRTRAFGQHDHVRKYGRDYPERLKSAGFQVIEDHFAKQFSAEDVKKYGILQNESIYVCRK